MKKRKNKANTLVFIGNYLDEKIIKERGLLAPNPAGSNRMLRLSKAIQTQDFLCYIISPACSARIKFDSKIVHPSCVVRKNGIIVIYASALAIPYFSMVFEFFSMAWIFLRLTFLRKVKVTLLYCYYPSTISVGLLAKLWGIKIIEDLEDIVTPKLSDWFRGSILISLQQSLGYILMRMALWLSDLVIIPSSSFLFPLLERKKHLIVDGCIDVQQENHFSVEEDKIRVLLAGMLDEEQGIHLYLQTLAFINANEKLRNRFKFEICGVSLDEEVLKHSFSQFSNLDLTYFGFVDSSTFNKLLNKAHLCLVLQNPMGRNAQQKTPSKGYEYMAFGKAIIVSSIGDYVNLPKDTCFLLNEYSAEELLAILKGISIESIVQVGENAKKYAAINWGYENVGGRIIKSLNE